MRLAILSVLVPLLCSYSIRAQNGFPRPPPFGNNFGGRPGFTPANPGRGPPPFPNNFPPNQPAAGGVNFGEGTGLTAFSGSESSPPRGSSCGSDEICKFYTECALFAPETFRPNQGSLRTCALSDGTGGVCCREVEENKVDAAATLSNRLGGSSSASRPSLDRNSVQTAVDSSQVFFNELDTTEQNLLERNLAVKRGTSSFGHLLFFQTSPRAIELSRFGLMLVQSTRDLVTSGRIQNRLSGNANDIGDGLTGVNVLESSVARECPAQVRCDPNLSNFYRNTDGTCNNLNNPKLGSSLTPLIRLVRPEYEDGIWSPRKARGGEDLPSPRLLSATFNPDVDTPNSFYSLWVMQFGQFLDHDLAHVPVFRFRNASGIECCTEDGDFLPFTLSHPNCLPIEIPADDGFFRPFRQRCMNFVRSMIGVRSDCSLGYADQLNQITSYLDNSNVYGSTVEEQMELREFQGGLMKINQFSANERGKGMLPLQTNPGDECTEPEKGKFCFRAGDRRVNEMIGLTVTHLIWLREHNRVARTLAQLNPQWNDEQLFQESRKIVNGEYQHIIYNEWLPIVVGRNFMEVYGILPRARGYYKGYNPRIDPSVSNAFTGAAFRMGHTLIQGLIPLLNEAGQAEDALVIHEHFNRPFRIQERRMVDKLLRGITGAKIQSFDRFITSEVTNRLFQEENKPFGMDLISLNIQRGRDHGLPGYNTYRELCRLRRARQFEDFGDWISPDVIAKLSRYYRSVDDVDLFVGGILERPLPGALMGPTFTCIIGDQFARARKGDRFTYDNGPSPSSFTKPQLKQIRRTSFARIICDNGDDIQTIQPFAFLSPEQDRNPSLSCNGNAIPRVDLTKWQQQ